MRRCRKCNVPLNGILGKISATLFKTGPSNTDTALCNKCEQSSAYEAHAKGPHHPSGKYRCQICERDIDEIVALTHIKSEEYIIELIKKDHPDWAKDKKTCHKCLDYYRRLIKEAEI
ncbi:MAG: hypothetical protein Q8N14_05575 [Candidatus Omnitrophota bacterium]|nr:hypothetical protein [Candidatus Omnitrophota bacterium]